MSDILEIWSHQEFTPTIDYVQTGNDTDKNARRVDTQISRNSINQCFVYDFCHACLEILGTREISC